MHPPTAAIGQATGTAQHKQWNRCGVRTWSVRASRSGLGARPAAAPTLPLPGASEPCVRYSPKRGMAPNSSTVTLSTRAVDALGSSPAYGAMCVMEYPHSLGTPHTNVHMRADCGTDVTIAVGNQGAVCDRYAQHRTQWRQRIPDRIYQSMQDQHRMVQIGITVLQIEHVNRFNVNQHTV